MSLFVVLGIIVFILVIVALSAIRVVQQYERGVIELDPLSWTVQMGGEAHRFFIMERTQVS